jgi:26S proteasome regulatory subunit N12
MSTSSTRVQQLPNDQHTPIQPPSPKPTPNLLTMAERDLQDVLRKLKSSPDYSTSLALLSKAKLLLLNAKALLPSPSTSPNLLLLARSVYEAGALHSILAKDADAFTRYVHQLTPFYKLPAARLSAEHTQKNKISGLYLMLLLTKGDYAGFHMQLEREDITVENNFGEKLQFVGYPIKLERWLRGGNYDLVYKALHEGSEVPSEEFGVFTEVCYLLIPSFILCYKE